MKYILMLVSILALTACSQENDRAESETGTIDAQAISLKPEPDTGRWYTEEQVMRGKEIFAENCAGCHGDNAESTPDWKTPDANGNYPPPPLNGSAHAWHHPLAVLKRVIEDGGEPYGGVMPAWGDTLSDRQIVDVIASFQSYWPEETYQLWLEREQASRGDP